MNPATSTNYCVILGESLDLLGPLFLYLEMSLVTVPASKGGVEHPGSRVCEFVSTPAPANGGTHGVRVYLPREAPPGSSRGPAVALPSCPAPV